MKSLIDQSSIGFKQRLLSCLKSEHDYTCFNKQTKRRQVSRAYLRVLFRRELCCRHLRHGQWKKSPIPNLFRQLIDRNKGVLSCPIELESYSNKLWGFGVRESWTSDVACLFGDVSSSTSFFFVLHGYVFVEIFKTFEAQNSTRRPLRVGVMVPRNTTMSLTTDVYDRVSYSTTASAILISADRVREEHLLDGFDFEYAKKCKCGNADFSGPMTTVWRQQLWCWR